LLVILIFPSFAQKITTGKKYFFIAYRRVIGKERPDGLGLVLVGLGLNTRGYILNWLLKETNRPTAWAVCL